MAALNPPVCNFGWPAPDFALPTTTGDLATLASCRGPNGLLVMFICNHCPYVQAVIDRIIRDCRELESHGVGSVAIMSNDVVAYPDDSFERMQYWARELDFPFPYAFDETQSVARAYSAVCTPDFFGFNADLQLQYRGRLDASGRTPGAADASRELFAAMVRIAATGKGPREQIPSIGCSIKWREN
ncbi:MAG TPA: thioredoxin family protein [Rhodocyclaceae bacterium]|nr:thioredoxin family protein [Rhodocyclaceae bacterium]